MRSKKAMSTLFRIILVLVAIVFLVPLLMKGWQWAKEGAGLVSPEEEKEITPALEKHISIAVVESGAGESLTVYPSSSTEKGDFDSIDCRYSCTLTLTFDRNPAKFSTDYFTVQEKRGWASGWREFTGINVVSLSGNKVTLTHFERDIKYFIKFSTTIDYEEAKTKENVKLNPATAVLRFETS